MEGIPVRLRYAADKNIQNITKLAVCVAPVPSRTEENVAYEQENAQLKGELAEVRSHHTEDVKVLDQR